MAEDSTDFYEDFDVNKTDFEYAMNPSIHKRQTKDQQIYGVFAPSSDEEENSDFKKFSSFGGKKKTSYNTPVSFISGGVKKGDKIELADGTIDEEKTDEADDFGKLQKRSRLEISNFGHKKQVGAQLFAGMRNGNLSDSVGSMAWTKNSSNSSVIMQMMQKMGYVHGKGLGLSKQGIVEPVQAVLRPGRGAIGAYGKEVKGPKFGESVADAQSRIATGESEEIDNTVIKHGNWRKQNLIKKEKIRYKTLNEVIDDNEPNRAVLSGTKSGNVSVKIIDMTGPVEKIYNDFSSFSRRAKAPEMESDRINFDIPELMFNLNTLIDLTEEEIRSNNRELKFLKDQTEVLFGEKKRLVAEMTISKSEITHLVEVAKIIRHQSPTLNECRDLFLRLRDEYSVEYKLCGLDSIIKSTILPPFRFFFAKLNPLDPENVRYGFDVMEEWRDILKISSENSNDSAYDFCIWEGWMPPVRRAILDWNPRDNGPTMMNFIEIWLPLLPLWITDNLLDLNIVPRIKSQVDQWDPRLDSIPIDLWLMPWHSIMGDRLILVYNIIQQKLKEALINWKPGDRSAIECIRPWKNVFLASTMRTFLETSIVPKFEFALHSIDLNTTEQFFHDCLYLRLSTGLANGMEYYKAWRSVFPESLIQTQAIRYEISKALMSINQVKNGLVPLPLPSSSVSQTPPLQHFSTFPSSSNSNTFFRR